MAEKLIKDVKYSVVPNKTAKQQSLLILKLLKKHPEIPMERMPMIITTDMTLDLEEEVFKTISHLIKNKTEKSKTEERIKYELVIDPSAFHELQLIVDKVKDKLILEILSVNQETD